MAKRREPPHGEMVWFDDTRQNYIPLKKVAENYARMMESGDYLSNRAAVDIIDARVLTLVGRIDLQEAPDRLKNLHAIWEEMKIAKRNEDDNGYYAASARMDAVFEAIFHDYASWEQMIEVLDLRRKMIDSELKIIKEKKAYLSVEMAYKLVAQLLAVCIRLIKDPKLLKQINYEFSKIIGENRIRTTDKVVDVSPEEMEDEDDE